MRLSRRTRHPLTELRTCNAAGTLQIHSTALSPGLLFVFLNQHKAIQHHEQGRAPEANARRFCVSSSTWKGFLFVRNVRSGEAGLTVLAFKESLTSKGGTAPEYSKFLNEGEQMPRFD